MLAHLSLQTHEIFEIAPTKRIAVERSFSGTLIREEELCEVSVKFLGLSDLDERFC